MPNELCHMAQASQQDASRAQRERERGEVWGRAGELFGQCDYLQSNKPERIARLSMS